MVADQLRVQVLVGFRVALNCGHMYPTLVGKCTPPHIGLVPERSDIGQFKDVPRTLAQFAELLIRDAIQLHLESDGWDNTTKIGVAAALAYPVHGTLNMVCTQLHSRQRVGHSQL